MASTADEDARANLLKSLGVARRRAPDAAAGEGDDAPAGGEADDGAPDAEDGAPEADDGAPAQGATIAGLGIKRRKPATGERPAAAVDGDGGAAPASGGGATGLGIKRRKGADAAPTGAGGDGDVPAAKPRRRLGNDQAATILASYFRGRPDLELPDRVWDLKRTHGFYTGDGRPERRLVVGFEPALVLYVIPSYPEKIWPEVVKQGDGWVSIDPGLHRQPRFTSDGFIVDEPYNELGEGYVYVAFRADGQPLELPDTTAHVAPEPKRGATTGLGIKRRK